MLTIPALMLAKYPRAVVGGMKIERVNQVAVGNQIIVQVHRPSIRADGRFDLAQLTQDITEIHMAGGNVAARGNRSAQSVGCLVQSRASIQCDAETVQDCGIVGSQRTIKLKSLDRG